MIWIISFVIFCVIMVGCNSKSELVGVWQAVSVDMSFAEGKIPRKEWDDAANYMLQNNNAPAFDLNSDGSARIFGRGECNGIWSFKENIVSIQCPGSFLKLEKSGNQLITLPNRSFTLERQ